MSNIALRFMIVAFVSIALTACGKNEDSFKSSDQSGFDNKVINAEKEIRAKNNEPRSLEEANKEKDKLFAPYYRRGSDSKYAHLKMNGWTCVITPGSVIMETTSVEPGEEKIVQLNCSNKLEGINGSAEFSLQVSPAMKNILPEKYYSGDVLKFSGEGFFTNVDSFGGYRADVHIQTVEVVSKSK
jgi:hypothetical protein